MAGNSASQKLSTPGKVPSGKENRQGPGATAMTNTPHSDSPADGRPTQFTQNQRDKLGDAPAL